MSMHLEGPWLTTSGKKKGKQKFRSAEEARKARELDESWQALKQKWGGPAKKSTRSGKHTAGTLVVNKPYVRQTEHYPSLNSGVDSSSATLSNKKVYTGDKIIGIGTMHKSNAVPIFSDNEAKEISSMRR
jgi:hypothetical protein